MGRILIKNGCVWDGNRLFYADVLTQDCVVSKIRDSIDEEADFVFDAKGKIVSAGLVDIHVHMRGPEPDKYGIHGEMSTIPFGVTAAADAGGAHADKTLVDSYLLKNVTFVKVPIMDNRADFTITEEKLRLYGNSAIGLKVYFDTKNTDVRDITPLRQVCQYARDRKLSVMVHCSNSPTPMAQILETLSAGDILTHAFHGGVHTAAQDNFESMREGKKRGVVIDTGFAGHIHTDFGVFRQAVEQGVLPDTISTDITRSSAYKRGGRYGMTMCMSMARTGGMKEPDIFRAVTSVPAKVLGKENRWGCLVEGGCADIAVLEYTDEGFDLTDRSGNHLASAEGYRCVLTVVNGDVVWRG